MDEVGIEPLVESATLKVSVVEFGEIPASVLDAAKATEEEFAPE